MYPHHVFDLEPAGTFGMYPICYWRVSGRYFQPEPAMYSRCFCWFPGPLAPSVGWTWMSILFKTMWTSYTWDTTMLLSMAMGSILRYVFTPWSFMKHLPRLKTNSRIMTFRNTIGNTAVTNVQSYLTRYTQDQTESYVRSAVMYHGEIPFLYRVFKPTNVSAKKEKGGVVFS